MVWNIYLFFSLRGLCYQLLSYILAYSIYTMLEVKKTNSVSMGFKIYSNMLFLTPSPSIKKSGLLNEPGGDNIIFNLIHNRLEASTCTMCNSLQS